ncbi:MAG TPA: sigma-70 family RNA polymerase sigma factor [Frankiaceae bacterium]|nr:sigma-70 family RNA polymerase sigma factor [Frankiaceae bacterium]
MPGDVWPEVVAHRERLLRIARRRCATREDAEDVVSEAMLRCATFEGLDAARMEQFLTAVTVRLCADLHRKAARRARAVVKLASDPDVAPGPEEELYGGVDAAALRVLLASLPERQRAVLADRAQGLSVQQIALRHALSYKAAESVLARARHAMRTALASSASVVVTVKAAFRPRRLALLAVPVVTFAVGTGALRLPLFDDDAPRSRVPRAAAPRVVPPRPRNEPPPVATPSVPTPAAPLIQVVAGVGETEGDDVRKPRRTRRVTIGDDPSLAMASITVVDPDEFSPRSRVRDCARGVYVDVTLEPTQVVGKPGGQPVRAYQGCG